MGVRGVEEIRVHSATMADYRHWAAVRVDAVNHALAGIPPDWVAVQCDVGQGSGFVLRSPAGRLATGPELSR